ncbi:MAG: 3-deoxy-7-phosphoheptulonate synthase, partial [Desulfosarcinaceae bacterium]
YAHLVLRGGRRPNYDSVSLREAVDALSSKHLPEAVIVDCSHANSRKRYAEQTVVWQDVLKQKLSGNNTIVGMMLESNIHEGRQDNTGSLATMKYGVSITDACISWETTEKLILEAGQQFPADQAA